MIESKAILQLLRVDQAEIFLTGVINQKHRKLLVPLLVKMKNEGYKPTTLQAFKESLSIVNGKLALNKNKDYYIQSILSCFSALYLSLISMLFLPVIFQAWTNHSKWLIDKWLGFGAYYVLVFFTLFLIVICIMRPKRFKELNVLLEKVQNNPVATE